MSSTYEDGVENVEKAAGPELRESRVQRWPISCEPPRIVMHKCIGTICVYKWTLQALFAKKIKKILVR